MSEATRSHLGAQFLHFRTVHSASLLLHIRLLDAGIDALDLLRELKEKKGEGKEEGKRPSAGHLLGLKLRKSIGSCLVKLVVHRALAQGLQRSLQAGNLF